MEAKTTRAADKAALCVLLALLSAMPGKAAPERPTPADFCKCYRPCYTECRRTIPWWSRFICVAKCLDDCSPHKLLAGGDPCAMACGGAGVNTICDTSEPEPALERDDAAGETAACVRGCNMWRQHSTK
ncbi:hypothetical protein BRADI_2g37280v3 [Brachypodium distachyon]|uniref:Bowman-Birk serine protease inhibitors family domain-containing protein n=1 Tax=Brachypodium distachyon TaxID=15368 RepID=I1HMA9_BRADI|nr:hypothetical protein BRADI_2g37280v3 [Brachypodium distachyon]